jgi:hypothetical protein
MIYAALDFEYVNAAAVLKMLPSLLRHDELLCTVVQEFILAKWAEAAAR